MTEQPGHLNAPDLVEECAKALSDECGRQEFRHYHRRDFLHYYPHQMPDEYATAVNAVLSILRKRGLLTEQALELLADK